MFQASLLCLCCLLVLCAPGSSASDDDAEGTLTLDLVQVIFRHGLRSPSKLECELLNLTEPTVPGVDYGALTNEGMRQEYELGRLLRRRYDEHLGGYDERRVVARSTAYSRTVVSLELVLAGLYPQSEGERWHPDVDWRPRPFWVADRADDALLSPHQSPRYLELYAKTIEDSKEYARGLSAHAELVRYMEDWTVHSNATLLYKSGSLYSILAIHKTLGLQLPSWCTDRVLAQLRDLFAFSLNSMSLTRELKKFNGAPLAGRLIDNVRSNREKAKRIYLYSTHDLTLTGFARAQDVVVGALEPPPFGSAYILESYGDSRGRDYVRMLSWDGSSDHFDEAGVRGCAQFCPLSEYESAVRDVVPTADELERFFSRGGDVSVGTGTLVAVASGAAVATALVLGPLCYLLWGRQRSLGYSTTGISKDS